MAPPALPKVRRYGNFARAERKLMNENVESLVLEHRRAIRTDMAKMAAISHDAGRNDCDAAKSRQHQNLTGSRSWRYRLIEAQARTDREAAGFGRIASTFMAQQLPPHIWFVRSNRGSGSYPVTPEGWRALWIFAAGVAASAIVGGLLAASDSPGSGLWSSSAARPAPRSGSSRRRDRAPTFRLPTTTM